MNDIAGIADFIRADPAFPGGKVSERCNTAAPDKHFLVNLSVPCPDAHGPGNARRPLRREDSVPPIQLSDPGSAIHRDSVPESGRADKRVPASSPALQVFCKISGMMDFQVVHDRKNPSFDFPVQSREEILESIDIHCLFKDHKSHVSPIADGGNHIAAK